MLTQPAHAVTLACRGRYLTESDSEVGGLSILTRWIRAIPVLCTQLVLLTRRMHLNADSDAGAGEHPPHIALLL